MLIRVAISGDRNMINKGEKNILKYEVRTLEMQRM